ncbi:membrane-associated HD superfamily phosphohydrolase [Bradyrhizobium japonicum]|uniref:Membrane-associated HD superfamily phosphohydrolase n=2 Tax=Nitrobacteraceae TaxID=41294 RepID=A0ABV2RXS8_BRAJP|nr:hypothetical protein RN69_25460 [Bradyrhizobium japonicum]KMJ98837.1 hypothetical protein CF64_11675 [Bradyrhizobium japonicum]
MIKMKLSWLKASALAAALIAAASVLALAQFPALFVWAAFIGWASYDHSGATGQAALRSSVALSFGAIMAWLVAIIVAARGSPASATLLTAIVAGIASFVIVAASRLRSLRIVPAAFYGFASTFAYLSLAPGAFTIEALISPSLRNAVFSVPLSLLVGTFLGIAHTSLARILACQGGEGRRSLSEAHASKGGEA